MKKIKRDTNTIRMSRKTPIQYKRHFACRLCSYFNHFPQKCVEPDDKNEI